MQRRLLASLVLLALGCALVFGAMLLVAPSHTHGNHCPFDVAQTALCATVLEHIDHMQSALSAALVEAVSLLGIAGVVYVAAYVFITRRTRAPVRRRLQPSYTPTLFQSLYSDGILNPKAP